MSVQAQTQSLKSSQNQEKLKALSRIEILKVLEDRPLENELFLNSEGGSSPWLIRTEIFEAFNAILNNNAYKRDPEIRSRLQTLSENHLFTVVRASAQLVLSDFQEDSIPPMFHHGRVPEGYEGLTAKQMNESMEYCAPPPEAKRPDFEIEADREGRRSAYRFSMPMRHGTLTGGYYSIQGIGLSYKKSVPPHEVMSISKANNRYIMKADTEDTYWLIDGPHHMIGGASISKLVETEAGLERYLHRVLPSTVRQVFEFSDGRIFINFVNLDPLERGGSYHGKEFTPSPLELYNPPIIVYPNGSVSLACTDDSIKF